MRVKDHKTSIRESSYNKIMKKYKTLHEVDLNLGSRLNKSNYKVPVKSLKGMENTDIADFRLRYAKDTINKLLPGFSSISWGNVKESDPDYSNFTTSRVTGDAATQMASKLLDASKQGKVAQYEEGKGEYRFSLPGLEDVQIFFNDSYDGSKDELILVVRPLEIPQEVTIVV